MQVGTAPHLILEPHLVSEIEIYPLAHVIQFKDVVDVEVGAVLHQGAHQCEIGDAEGAETAESGAGVHQKAEQLPTLRVEHIVDAEAARLGLVDCREHVVEGGGKPIDAPKMVKDYPRGGRCCGVQHVFRVVRPPTQGFAYVIVEGQVYPRHIGEVRGDVLSADRDHAVLHVLGVHEKDLVDQVQMLEQDGADKAVEIAARDQPSP